jgi:hypothetical protein
MKHVRNFNETIDITNYSNLKKWVKDDDKIEKFNIIKPKNDDIENLRTEIENKNKIFQKKIIDYILYFMNEYKIEDIGIIDTTILCENNIVFKIHLKNGKIIVDVDTSWKKYYIEDMYNIYDMYNYIKKIEKDKTLLLKSIIFGQSDELDNIIDNIHDFLENNIDEIDLYISDNDNIINFLMYNDHQSEPIADYFDSYEFQKLAFSEKEDQMIELYKKYYDNKTDDAVFIIDDKIKEEFDEFFGMEDIGLR